MPNSLLAPSPLLKDEPASGLDCSGISKPRRISVKAGRQQGRLCTAGNGREERIGGRGVEGGGGGAGSCANVLWCGMGFFLQFFVLGNWVGFSGESPLPVISSGTSN